MSGFRKRSPSGAPSSRPPPAGREPRQNPQRWRQAFGDLRPAGTIGQERRSDFAMKWGNADASLVRRPEDPPSPQSLPPQQPPKPPIRLSDPVKRRLAFTPSSDSSSSMDGLQAQQQSEAGTATTARNPIWKSSFRRADDANTRSDPTPPPPVAPSTPPQGQMSGDRELDELMAKPARTAEERYKSLDTRDKLIRKRNPKVKVRVEFAVKLAGTCLDMCPEKERYMREFQRRLSIYECDPSQDSVVDHRLAIKEYSRSSADQEEPLPHDLRPIQALHLTFDYLLHNMMNRLEDESENLSELYCFIWDRTRAIRKDVTQQQLGTTEAVLLMEKCVRFHIYCSSRLCELDRHSFDPKLNDENLMKCLQSLEHMYQDLAPHGVKCPNEPEFRAYQILMHLNEGDIIQEIQRKPSWILKSGPVEHALKIYTALNSMNSVAFFRLVEASSFMVSSILHRYFFQIRTNVLRRLLKTYSLKGTISMPTMQVKRMLGFGSGDQNINTFKYFCEAHGFSIRNIGDSSMTMSHRSDFEQPEYNLINREPSLIESKLTVSISEAINGAPLGENPLTTFTPHSSFDDLGYFKRELLEPLRLVGIGKSAATPPTVSSGLQMRTASPQSQLATSSTGKVVDLRGRLGTRMGPPPAGAPNPFGGIPKPPMSISSASALPPSASTFSFAAPKGTFGFTAPPAGFSFATPQSTVQPAAPAQQNTFIFTTSSSGLPAAPTFTFAKPTRNLPSFSASYSTAPQPAEFAFTTQQSEAAALQLQKAKEEKMKIGAEVGMKAVAKILEEVVQKEVREIVTLVRQEHVVKAAKEATQLALVTRIYKEVEEEVCHRLLLGVAEGALEKARATALACSQIEEDLRRSVVRELITEIVAEVLKDQTAAHNARLAKLDGICQRINLRYWFIFWKSVAEERKTNRIQELQRQKWNVENFPPILASQLPTATILDNWSSSTLQLAGKPLIENYTFNLVERAMEVKRSFEKHLQEFRPSVIHHLAAPLLNVLNAHPPLPSICVPFHPPLAINIVLLSDFDPWDHLANWVWASLSEDSVPLGDPYYAAHRLPLHDTKHQSFLTFQKCSDMVRASSDSCGLLAFVHSPRPGRPDTLEQLRSFVTKNPTVPIVLFNSSRSSEVQIRHRLGSTLPHSAGGHVIVLDITKGQVIENIPTLVNGLHWMAHKMDIGPPVVPPVILLPFSELAGTLMKEVFPRRVKGVNCPLQLFQEHNALVGTMKGLVENPETLKILKKWPGRASKLLIQKFSKGICFSHEEGKLGVVIKNMTEVMRMLEIDPPAELIAKTHEGIMLRAEEIESFFKKFIGNLMAGYEISDNLRTRFNYIMALQMKSPGTVQWRDFLTICQECVLEKLSSVTFGTYQVCVDLDMVTSLGVAHNSSKCPYCPFPPGPAPRKRGFSLDKDFSFLVPKSKAVCQDSAARTLLKDIRILRKEMKEEKEVLEASFTTQLESSYLS